MSVVAGDVSWKAPGRRVPHQSRAFSHLNLLVVLAEDIS
jgi:hypothetical protein